MKQIYEEPSSFISGTNTIAVKWSSGGDHSITFVSENVLELTGYSASELVSGEVSLIDLFETVSLASLKSNVAEKEALTVLLQLRTKSGDKKWVEAKSLFVTSSKGEVSPYTIMNDISERVEVENRILEQNRYLRNISWIQSHEVRAPLSRILGIISLIDTQKEAITRDYPEFQVLLDSLCASAEELDDVIKRISDISYQGIVNYKK